MADAPFTFLPLGAIIQSFNIGGINIVQGFPTAELYKKYNGPYFGETIGRVANRISNAKIDALNGGKTYTLAANNGPNNLHGGNVGWGKRVWNGPKPVGIRKVTGVEGGDIEGESVEFSLISEDGDEGFPGTVQAKVIYTAGTQKVDGQEAIVLGIEYEAELVGGAEETAINITNHSYFNLSGNPTIEGTKVTLSTDSYLPVDAGGIPTGGPTSFSAVKANEAFTLGATDPDIDDCFVVDPSKSQTSVPLDTRNSPLTKLVSAEHPQTGIHLEVYSTEPAFQFYTGKYIDVPEVDGPGGIKIFARGARSGFCVEPSRYVNAVNVPEWKNQVLVKKGEKYGAKVAYKGWRVPLEV